MLAFKRTCTPHQHTRRLPALIEPLALLYRHHQHLAQDLATNPRNLLHATLQALSFRLAHHMARVGASKRRYALLGPQPVRTVKLMLNRVSIRQSRLVNPLGQGNTLHLHCVTLHRFA